MPFVFAEFGAEIGNLAGEKAPEGKTEFIPAGDAEGAVWVYSGPIP